MLSNAGAAATIAVRDLDAAKLCYTETLGLKIADDVSPRAIIFVASIAVPIRAPRQRQVERPYPNEIAILLAPIV